MSPPPPATAPPSDDALGTLLRRYGAGTAISCQPVAQGLLNRGYRVSTTRGRFFLKHYLKDADRDTSQPATIARQHRATLRLGALGLPVAAPLADTDGRTVAVIGGRRYALYPWIEGRHRAGGELSGSQCRRLGALLGLVHTSLARVLPDSDRAPGARQPDACADPADTYQLIEDLLRRAADRRPRDAFDELAEHRLRERRDLLRRHEHRRPSDATTRITGWVHGDFHPLNLLYHGREPAAIIDWDRLGIQPRAEEAVRAAVIFFLRAGDGSLDLERVRHYARAYRTAAGVPREELAAAVHRVWWERLNDFWMLRWRYERQDLRADPLFPAAAGLVVWWTREYEAVLAAFTG